MSYQVHNFRTGDIVEAAPVNEMDAQIQLNEQNIGSKIGRSDIGVANGVAGLDSSGKVPASQLPSFVDDVVEYASFNDFPETGESGKIYIALDTNKTFRWGGSIYVEISASLTLGETDTTAYRGDRGKAAYDHAMSKGAAFESGFYKIQTNAEGHVIAVVNVTKNDITDLGIPGDHQDISGKADKVTNATNGNFASLDSNGNLIDSGHKHSDYLTQHQDISGKADKDTDAVVGNFASFDANGNPVDSGHKHSDYLTQHQDISGKIDVSEKGAANGVAELDADGKVPSAQLPSFVDDVMEYADASSFPVTGEAGKIYVAMDTNKTYRWSGTQYVPIASDLALGETSSTAYRGDRGKIAYDHATDPDKVSSASPEGLYKVAVTQEGHVKSVSPVQKSDIVLLGIPAGSTYTHIRYSAVNPTSDSDMKTTPDEWMGFAITSTPTDPTSYTDYTWYKIKGETGAQGATGNGISNSILNQDYTLTITYTDGTDYTTPSIRGEPGAQGDPGPQGGGSVIRKIEFSLATSDWTAVTGGYMATVTDQYVDANTLEQVFYDASKQNMTAGVLFGKNASNALTFTTETMPTGTISGTICVIESTTLAREASF